MNPKSPEKSDVLLKFFEEGKQFSMDLLKENERLRLSLASQKSESASLKNGTGDQLVQLDKEKEHYKEELEKLRTTLEEVELENNEIAENYVKVEEQNQNMASLYVASYRLHSTLDFKKVIEIIKEIVINLIGSEHFGIFLKDERSNALCPIASEGIPIQKIESIKIGVGLSRKATETGDSYVYHVGKKKSDEALACIPLI